MADDQFGNIGPERFKEIQQMAADAARGIRDIGKELKASGDDAEISFAKQVNLARDLAGITASTLKDKTEVASLERRARQAREDEVKAANRLSEINTNLAALAGKTGKNAELQRQALYRQYQITSDLKNNFGSIALAAESLVAESKKLASQTKFFDKLVEAAQSIPGLGPLIVGPFKEAATAAKEAAEKGVGKMQVYLKGSVALAKSLAKSLGPAALLASMVQSSKETKDLSNNLGVSLERARQIQLEFGNFALQTGDARINSTELAKAQGQLSEQLRLGVQFSGEVLSNFVKLTEYMGVSAKAAAQLSLISESLGESSSEFQGNLAESVVQSSRALGINIPLKEAFEEIGNLSTTTLINLGRNPEQIGRAVAEARKLGMELESIRGISRSLLDFESSIANELEAELFTGREINLERARLATLKGDDVSLTREIASQVGTISEFENMSVLAREALAKSFGLNVDQLGTMLLRQEALNKLGDDAKDASEEQLRAAQARVTATKDLGQALLEVQQEAELSKNFENSAKKIQDAFKQVALEIMPPIIKLVDKLADLVASPMGKAIAGLAVGLGAISGLVGALRPLLSLNPATAPWVKVANMGGAAGRGGLSRTLSTLPGGSRYGRAMAANRAGRFGASRAMGAGAGLGFAAGGSLVQLAGNYFADEFEEKGNTAAAQTTDVVSGIGQGALYGAALGSIVPGIGTAAGAIVGGAIGLISGGLEAANRNAEDAKKANEAKEDRIEKALNKLAEKEAKIFMDSNQVGMGLTLGKNYAV